MVIRMRLDGEHRPGESRDDCPTFSPFAFDIS